MALYLTEHDSNGHNLHGNPSMNVAGLVYTTFITAYTGILLYSLCMLWLHRQHPAVRIRGFYITTIALLSIHVYVAALFIVYPLNGWYKCGTEFWYMSIIFPLGIALFQAANVKLMAVAQQQQDIGEFSNCWAEPKQPFRLSVKGVRSWLRQFDYVTKTYFAIGCGLLLQLIITLVLFFGSRRFNPTTGFFGEHVGPAQCREGAEWIPSVIWQFLWSWVFGPVVLYKTRHIKDTHNWALQTRLSVIAGMPGAPMWLAFLYAGGTNATINSFNLWWPPAMWFAPGLITIQMSSLIIPFYDIWRHRGYNRPPSQQSTLSESSTVRPSISASSRKSKELGNNWEAFEFQLKHNIDALFYFAANKDFTAENILFLMEVRDFKRKWRRRLACPPNGGLVLSLAEQQAMFEDAARIYFGLVCSTTSRCSINVDSRINGTLKDIFKDVSYEPPAEGRRCSTKCVIKPVASRLDVAPWESPALTAISHAPTSLSLGPSETALDASLDGQDKMSETFSLSLPSPAALEHVPSHVSEDIDSIRPVHSISISTHPTTHLLESERAILAQRGRIVPKQDQGYTTQAIIVPSTFSLRVFDKAEDSIKYLVYTNTWKSYVSSDDSVRINSVGMVESRRPSNTESLMYKSEIEIDSKTRNVSNIEIYEADLEMQNTFNAGVGELHHGVLDVDGHGSVPLHDVDSRCASCRRKEERMKRSRVVVRKM